MCLMLYLAASHDVPLRTSPDLKVEEVEPSRETARQWFALPTVRFIGAHTGCSCGFPSVSADEPVDYFDGIFQTGPDREADLRSVHLLVALLREHVGAGGAVELYPVWDGEEGSPPKGAIELALDGINPETFFFNERFFYRVT